MLAHRVFEAAAALDPHAPITLSQGAMRMRQTRERPIDYDPRGLGPRHDTHQVEGAPAPQRPRAIAR